MSAASTWALAQAAPVAESVVFYVVGAIALGAAITMVLMRNPVHAALMLVINFFAIAVLYAVLEAQFLAVVQIIVYAGAVMVLFLFVLMLLGVAYGEAASQRLRGQRPAAVVLGALLLVVLVAGVAGPYLSRASVCAHEAAEAAGEGLPCIGLAAANAEGNTQGVGLLLFTDYVWPFEVTSVLLVIAAVGAIVLARKREDPADLLDRPRPRMPVRQATGTRDPARGTSAIEGGGP